MRAKGEDKVWSRLTSMLTGRVSHSQLVVVPDAREQTRGWNVAEEIMWPSLLLTPRTTGVFRHLFMWQNRASLVRNNYSYLSMTDKGKRAEGDLEPVDILTPALIPMTRGVTCSRISCGGLRAASHYRLSVHLVSRMRQEEEVP